jgi:hypothetical protein
MLIGFDLGAMPSSFTTPFTLLVEAPLGMEDAGPAHAAS